MKKTKTTDISLSKKHWSRREFTKTTTALAAGVSIGVFSGAAPAIAKKRKVHHVAWNNFIPPADDHTKTIAKAFEKDTGIAVQFETIGQNDLQARAAAAIEGGAGPDILQLHWNHAHLYSNGLIDHSKIADLDGGNTVYEFQKEAVTVDGVPRGIPYYSIGNIMAYRTDVYKDLNIAIPETWDEYLAAGTKCKSEGFPFGQTLGHTLGDAPMFCYPLMWSFGGSEIDESGKVAINSAATRSSVEWMKEAWEKCFAPGGLSWDDGSNNRAFLSEQIFTTANGASIYFVARMKKMNHIADNMSHYMFPKGPGGQFATSVPLSFCIPKYSKNQDEAMEWIRYQLRDDNYTKYIAVQNCFALPRKPGMENHPVWTSDPAVSVFSTVPQYGRNFGWPGPFGRKASEAQSKYIIVDMYARAVQGASAQEAVAWAEKELKNVYGG